MTNRKILIISLVVFFICLIGKILLWEKLSEPPILPATSEISREEALRLANQVLEKECNLSFSQIERIKWTKGPDVENLKRKICPAINEYKENKIWRAEKPLNENIDVIGLVGIYGKFVCLYGLDKRAAPGIISVDKACEQREGVIITTDKTKYVKVIFPNGKEKLVVGNSYSIKWEAGNIDKVEISIWDTSVKSYGWPPDSSIVIAEVPADEKEYSWTISPTLFKGPGGRPKEFIVPGHYYKILITDSKNYSIYDESDECFSIIPTANWKTYTNKEHGFEIKYPQNWNVVAPYVGGVGLFSIAFYPSDKMYSPYGIFFDLVPAPKEGDFQDFREIQKKWETEMEKEREKFLQSNFEKKVIAENTVLFKISGIMKGEKTLLGVVAEGYIIHQTNDFYYVFSFHTLGGKETVDILEQMLSTFRFFEQDETANWKIYSNPEANFIFKYPNNWEIKKDYEYKSAACQVDPKCKGVRVVDLGKMGDSKILISINRPQCSGIKHDMLPGNSWICVFDENLEILNVYEKIKDSFQVVSNNQEILFLSPKKGEKWKIGETHTIEISQPIEYFYPFTHLTLNKPNGEEVGIIWCKIGRREGEEGKVIFNWDTATLLKFCGAGSKEKIKEVKPGTYMISITKDVEGRPIIASSELFSIVGE